MEPAAARPGTPAKACPRSGSPGLWRCGGVAGLRPPPGGRSRRLPGSRAPSAMRLSARRARPRAPTCAAPLRAPPVEAGRARRRGRRGRTSHSRARRGVDRAWAWGNLSAPGRRNLLAKLVERPSDVGLAVGVERRHPLDADGLLGVGDHELDVALCARRLLHLRRVVEQLVAHLAEGISADRVTGAAGALLELEGLHYLRVGHGLLLPAAGNEPTHSHEHHCHEQPHWSGNLLTPPDGVNASGYWASSRDVPAPSRGR